MKKIIHLPGILFSDGRLFFSTRAFFVEPQWVWCSFLSLIDFTDTVNQMFEGDTGRSVEKSDCSPFLPMGKDGLVVQTRRQNRMAGKTCHEDHHQMRTLVRLDGRAAFTIPTTRGRKTSRKKTDTNGRPPEVADLVAWATDGSLECPP